MADRPDRERLSQTLSSQGRGTVVYVLHGDKDVVLGCYTTVEQAESYQWQFGGWIEAVSVDAVPNFARV